LPSSCCAIAVIAITRALEAADAAALEDADADADAVAVQSR
jgi:hypothetical protein